MTVYVINFLTELMTDPLKQLGFTEILAKEFVRSFLIFIILFLSWFVYKITQGPLIKFLEKITASTNMQWDNFLLERRVFHRLLNFIPLILVYILIPPVLSETTFLTFSQALINSLFIIIGMMTFDSFLNAVLDIYSKTSISNDISIKPFVQIFKLVLYFVTVILLLSLILQKTPK